MMDVDINLIMVSVDVNATKQNQILDLGDKVNNLYMTTEEFAALVVDALDAQDYFKKDSPAHPEDIAIAFATVSETIGAAMSWAISKDHERKKKQAMMEATNLTKNNYHTGTTSYGTATYSRNTVLPVDDEIAPALLEEGESLVTNGGSLAYSEWMKSR